MASTQEPVNNQATASALKAADTWLSPTAEPTATMNKAMNGPTIHATER